MRTWTIAAGPVAPRSGAGSESCGCCGRQVPNGDPMQVIELPGVQRRFRRCGDCAVGPVDWAAVDAARQAQEARAAAEQFTPEEFLKRVADPGKPATMTPIAQAVGNLFDELTKEHP